MNWEQSVKVSMIAASNLRQRAFFIILVAQRERCFRGRVIACSLVKKREICLIGVALLTQFFELVVSTRVTL